MKFVGDITQGLEEAAARLVKGIDTASSAVDQAASTLSPSIAQRLDELQSALAQLGADLSSLQAELDPGPVVDSLRKGAASTRQLLVGFTDEVGRLPEVVGSLDGQMRLFIEQSRSQLQVRESRLAHWREVAGVTGSLEGSTPADPDFKRALESWWDQASQALSVVDRYVSQASTATDAAAVAAFRQDAVGALLEVRTQVIRSCADYRQSPPSPSSTVDASGADAQSPAGVVAAPSPPRISLAPLDEAVSRARKVIPDVAAQVRKPLGEARAQVTALQSRVEVAGSKASDALNQALAPLRDIPQRLSQLVVDLSSALSAFESAIQHVKDLINDLIDLAKDLMDKLGRLPEFFVPVRSAIEVALEQIRSVGARIPPFVQQSQGALTIAAGELTQADSLCDNAIAVCTRYMTKAPLLIPARALFMGIKATIPAAHAAIGAAKVAVGQVGATAELGIDQGCAAVQALHPSVEVAVSQIKAAADRLVGMIKVLEGTLVQGGSKVDATGDAIESQFNQASKQVQASAARLAQLPQEFLNKVPVEATVESIRGQIKGLADRGFAQAEGAIGQAEERMEALLASFDQQVRAKWAQAEAALQAAATELQQSAARFEAAAPGIQHQTGSKPNPPDRQSTADGERARLEQLFDAILQRLIAVDQQVLAQMTRSPPSTGAANA